MSTQTVCRAKNPATCRKHGTPGTLSFDAYFGDTLAKITRKPQPTQPDPKPIGLTIRASETHYRAQILADIEQNKNLRVNPKTGEKTVSIFRSGIPSPPTGRGIEKASYQAADNHAPTGRQGRTTGIFASANMDTALRWYHANSQGWSKITDYGLREIRVNPDTTYIYSVSNWERASNAARDIKNQSELETRLQPAMEQYWQQSMTLTDWYQYVKDNPTIDTRDWEIVIGTQDIKQVKSIGPKRILDNCIRDWDRKDIQDTVKNEARAKRDKKRYG